MNMALASGIQLYVGDKVLLEDNSRVDITSIDGDTITGINLQTKEEIEFDIAYVKAYSKNNIKCYDGDNGNYWLIDASSSAVIAKNVANWVAYNIPEFEGISPVVIEHRHIYWATNSPVFFGNYSENTYVVYLSIDRLPENMKIDAQYDIDKKKGLV